VNKNGFKKVVLGLSGGVDSALTASIAVDALGTDRVVVVGMPSQFSSRDPQEDTRRMAENLGCELIWISIQSIYESYLQTLKQVFGPHAIGVTEENIQSRIRGNLLMALSNYHGWLVLTTGNKSEASVGYCTLYGDMAGGVSVIKDLSKALVYRLCRFRNGQAGRPWIPQSILERAPSAELKPNQRDSDSLPEYDILDRILQAYVEEEQSFDEILALGLDPETVRDVIGKVDSNEYKRRQSPPGLKITPRALGKDRRLPITNRYRIFNGSNPGPEKR
jgi:NAD+ synthase (glutamine-hydrolysing)